MRDLWKDILKRILKGPLELDCYDNEGLKLAINLIVELSQDEVVQMEANGLGGEVGDPVWEYLDAGKALMTAAKWTEAIVLYQEAISHYPDRAELYRALGFAQEKVGDSDGRRLSYQKAIRLDPQQPVWVYGTLAYLLIEQQQDWEVGLGVCQQGIEQYPQEANLYRYLGFTQEKLGAVAAQIASYQRAVELGRQPIWVYETLMELLMRQGNLEQAVAIGQLGLEQYPEQSTLRQRLVELKWEQQASQNGTIVVEQPESKELIPLEAYVEEAKKLTEQEKFEDAIEIYQEAIEKYSEYAFLYQELGIVQEKVGDVLGEILSYRRAIELEPKQPAWLYSTLATLMAKQGQVDQAALIFEQSLELYPQNVEILRQLVKVLVANEEYEKAEKTCKVITTLKQGDPWIWKELAEIQHKQSRLEEALKNIQKAIQLLPGNCWLTWELVSILIDQGNEQDATIEAQRIINDQNAPNWLKTQCLKALAELKQDALQSKLHYYQAFHLDRNDFTLKEKSLDLLSRVVFDIAEFYFNYHMWQEAELMYSFFCKLNPENYEMRYKLGNVLEHLAQREEAIKIYQQCVDLEPDNVAYMERLGDLMSSYGGCHSFRELCFP